MDMDMDMPMGHVHNEDGDPNLFYLQRMYWAVVGTAIGIATLANVLNKVVAAQRFWDTSPTPAKPKSLLFGMYASITAMSREVSYASLAPLSIWKVKIQFPALGRLIVLLANLVVLLVLCFYKLNTLDQWSWEKVGYRTGFVTIAQLPLILLLVGKNNVIGLLTGSSYERLNWFHRWVARTLWLTATIHMGFWFRSWGRYDYIRAKLSTDQLSRRGFAAWCVLTFMVIASLAPIRRWSYEIFLLQHLLTFGGFIAAVWLHAPREVKVWVWIPIGLFAFDRTLRLARLLYLNLALPGFFSRKRDALGRSPWAHPATFTPLPGDVTRVTIQTPGVSWKPGQHVLLSCHAILPLQSHPFSITSIPSDNKLEFLVRAEKGGTKKFFHHASSCHNGILGEGSSDGDSTRLVTIDGPYGRMRPLGQFDSVVLLAGGMGATYTMPLMREIVETWRDECVDMTKNLSNSTRTSVVRCTPTKRIRFVWVVRSRSQLCWFSNELRSVMLDMDNCLRMKADFDKVLEISIYITCDEGLSEKRPSLAPQPSLPRVIEESKEQNKTEGIVTIRALSSSSASPSSPSVSPPGTSGSATDGTGCLPQGECRCCAIVIEDEKVERAPSTCTCSTLVPNPPAPPVAVSPTSATASAAAITIASTSSSTINPDSHQNPDALHPRIRVFSGRPELRTIIRNVLEHAMGESAVVVCGPPRLESDVRRSVVSLSDERAVHKGTGAQGIYLHVESFEY